MRVAQHPFLILRATTASLLLWLVLLPAATAALADEAIPHRVLVGLNLFPNILSVTKGGAADQPQSDAYLLLLVYQNNSSRAEKLASKLRKSTKKINRRQVIVEAVAMDVLAQRQGIGLFLTEKIDDAALQEVSRIAVDRGALLFSSFEGDVEAGAMGGLDVRAKIRPFLNLSSLDRAGLEINAVLKRMSRTVE